MMLQPVITIKKSLSCPAEFREATTTTSPQSPPASNGPLRKTDSRDSRKTPSAPHYSRSFSGNETAPATMTPALNHRSAEGGVAQTSTAKTPASTGSKAVPGRPRRRGNRAPATYMTIPKSKKDPAQSLRYRLLNARWMKYPMKSSPNSSFTSLLVAVMLWYLLGVISITTSNLLMMKTKSESHVGGVPPLYLTLQQLIIGTIMLRFLLNIGFMGSAGIQPWPSPSAAAQAAAEQRRKSLLFNNHVPESNTIFSDLISSNLVLAGICFALGFLATNSGFLASSASFVETVKAAEPITSAAVAVIFRIETMGNKEVASLLTIVGGVLISTLAHGASKAPSPDIVGSTLMQSLQSCMVVMASNLCFSFRGLYQKLFRASPEGSSQAIDDLNLQLRMQQIGVLLLAVPVVVFDLPVISASVWELAYGVGLIRSGVLFRYLALATVNGVAFTSYNLASTFILSRISVVHHAALNCIRRIFAIVITSIYFSIPITAMGIVGFFISFGGFMAFTHFKIKRQKQPKPLSSLLPVSAKETGKAAA